MCGCVAVWLCVCVWLCGCVAVWLCGFVVVWLCACVLVWLCGCVLVCLCAFLMRPATVTAYLSERMHLTWRRRLVRVLHQRYFHGRLAYWLNSIDGSVDNIDQRVTQDVEQFTVQSTDVLFGSYPIAVATASTATGASLCSSITSIGITSYFIASQVDPKAVGALFGCDRPAWLSVCSF